MKCVTDALLYPWLYEGRLTEKEGEIAVKWLYLFPFRGTPAESFREPGSKLLFKMLKNILYISCDPIQAE